MFKIIEIKTKGQKRKQTKKKQEKIIKILANPVLKLNRALNNPTIDI